MISRRLFLGGLATAPAAAEPLLRTFLHDLDLELERGLELRDDDVLVVRVPAWLNQNDVATTAEYLREHVWPNVAIIPAGVEIEILRRPS